MTSSSNPWGREALAPVQAALLALSMDPKTPESISAEAGLSLEETRAALETLTTECLAIPDNGQYELSGPLSWFGDFESAVRYYTRRNFIVSAGGQTHVYLIDVRVKGGRPAGDPLTETLGVFACGKTARDIRVAPFGAAVTCEDCNRAGTSAETNG